MHPSTRPEDVARWRDRLRDAHVDVLVQRVGDLHAEARRLRADRDWWRRACWACLGLALVAAGGWAWTVMR